MTRKSRQIRLRTLLFLSKEINLTRIDSVSTYRETCFTKGISMVYSISSIPSNAFNLSYLGPKAIARSRIRDWNPIACDLCMWSVHVISRIDHRRAIIRQWHEIAPETKRKRPSESGIIDDLRITVNSRKFEMLIIQSGTTQRRLPDFKRTSAALFKLAAAKR